MMSNENNNNNSNNNNNNSDNRSITQSNPHEIITTTTSSSRRRPPQQNRLILPEETYQHTLSNIIRRNYYPSLPSLHRDIAILTHRSNGNVAGAVAVRRAARILQSHEESADKEENRRESEAVNGNSNGNGNGNGNGVRITARPLERESVDGFHARVTSEDNAHFEYHMREEAAEKRRVMDVVFNTSGVDYKNVGEMLQNGNGEREEYVEDTKVERLVLAPSPLMASNEEQFTQTVERVRYAGTTADGKNNTNDRSSLFFAPEHIHDEVGLGTGMGTSGLLLLDNNHKNDAVENDGTMETGMGIEMGMMPPPSKNTKGIIVHNSLPHSNTNPNTNSNQEIELHSKLQQQHQQHNIHMAAKMHLVEYQAKPSTDLPTRDNNVPVVKQIIPRNTRFPFQNESRLLTITTSSRTTVEDIIGASSSSAASSSAAAAAAAVGNETDAGTDTNTTDSVCYSSATDLDASPQSLSMERRARQRMMQNKRYDYVNMTPTREELYGCGYNHDTDLSTNDDGSIATMDTMSTTMSFQLPSVDHTESIAKRAEERVAERIKLATSHSNNSTSASASSSSSVTSTRPGSQLRTKSKSSKKRQRSIQVQSQSTSRIQSLTPAARLLLERTTTSTSVSTATACASTLQSSFSSQRRKSSSSSSSSSSIISARSKSAFGSALRDSYTPLYTPAASSSSSSSSLQHTSSRRKIGGAGRRASASASARKGEKKYATHVYNSTPILSRKG